MASGMVHDLGSGSPTFAGMAGLIFFTTISFHFGYLTGK
jgi:hypothetical protein